MPALTSGEQTLLRDNHPHSSRVFMSVLVPDIVYIGQVTGSPNRGDRVITVIDVTGTISNIVEGMTVLIGTSSGDDNVDRRRFRSRSGQDLTLDENSTVWADGQFITVIEFWELWPIYPFIDETPPYTFYKDRDITYAAAGNPNSQPPPVAIIDGNHMAGMLRGSSITFPLVSSNSYPIAPGASISSHAWVCPGGTIANAAASSTTVSFNVAGTYQLSLTVTDSNGKSQTTRRVIFVHDTGVNYPLVDFSLEAPIVGAFQKGGWRTTINMRNHATSITIPDRSLVVLWYEGFYQGVEHYIGANGNILLTGYIRGESVKRDPKAGSVTFEVTTIEDKLKNHNNFSVSLTDVSSPAAWWQYANLTVARACHHLWKWHSTLLNITNVYLPIENTTRLPAVDDFTNGTLYALVQSFASQYGIAAHVACNKLGDVYVEVNIQMLNDADRAAKPTTLAITEEDRRGDIDVEIVRTVERRTSFVMLSGVTYDGTTTTPIIAKAPGEVPHTEGSGMLNVERQVLTSQHEANERVGRYMALANIILGDIRMPMAGMYVYQDIVPQEWHTIDLSAADTKRGLVYNDLRIVPRMISISRNEGGALLVDTTFEAEATGEDGIAGRFPTEVPPPPLPEYPELFEGTLVAFNDVEGCYVEGSWVERNGSLGGSNIQDQFGGRDPWWFTSGKQASLDPADSILYKCDVGAIFKSSNQGVSWSNITPSIGVDGYDATDFTYTQYEGNDFTNGQHLFLAVYDDAGTWVSYILMTEDDGSTWTWKIIGGSGISLSLDTIDADMVVDHPQTGTAVQIDANHIGMLFFAGATSTSTRVIVVNLATGVVTSSIATSQTGSSLIAAICRLEDNRIVIVDKDGDSSSVNARVVNIVAGVVGTSSDIEVFTATGASPTALSVVRVSNTSFVVSCNRIGATDKGSLVACEYNVGTNSLSKGSEVDFYATSVSHFSMVEANNGAHLYYVDSALSRLSGVLVTVTGTSVSLGSPQNIVSDLPKQIFAANIDADKDLVSYVNADDFDNLYCLAVTLNSGSTIKDGLGGVEVKNAVVTATCTTRISSTAAYISYHATDVHYKQITITGHAVSIGSEINYPSNALNYPVIFQSSSGLVLAYRNDSITPRYQVFAGGVGAAKALGMSISKGFGTVLYVTTWLASNELAVHSYELPSLDLIASVAVASCTEAELDNGAYSLFPFANYLEFDGQIYDGLCYFYGRVDDTILGFGSMSHVFYTDDGGFTFYQLEDRWGTDSCGAFLVDARGRLFAMRNHAVGSTLYRGTLRLSVQGGSVPFRVYRGGLVSSRNGFIIVGGISRISNKQIMYTRSPYNQFLDLTQNYPTGGAVTSLVII